MINRDPDASDDDTVEPVHSTDTPIHRATILQLRVDEIDAMLVAIRARRMVQIEKLEALAKIKADDAILTVFIRLEKAIAKAHRAVSKAAEYDAKAEAALHKARLLAVECSTR